MPRIAAPAARRLTGDDPNPGRDVLATLEERASYLTSSSGDATHAVIPYNDFVYLLALKSAQDAIPMLDDPKAEWIPLEKWMADVAAPGIASIRKRKRLTQKQLGTKLGMPQSQVSRMEKNPEGMTYRTLKRVAKALGVEVSALL